MSHGTEETAPQKEAPQEDSQEAPQEAQGRKTLKAYWTLCKALARSSFVRLFVVTFFFLCGFVGVTGLEFLYRGTVMGRACYSMGPG
jgi:hypothetical protein